MTWSLLFGLAAAGEALWAGVPLASLETLGVGTPTVSHLGSSWRAPLPGGGIVDLTWYATPELALAAAQGRIHTAAQHPLPALGQDLWGAPGDILLARDRNVLIFVRALDGTADTALQALQAALVVDATGPDWQTRVVDGVPVAWDSCGRRRVGD